MNHEPPAFKYLVPGLEKGLRLLLEFGRHRGDLSFLDLCQRSGLPKSTVFRTLQTLEQLEFITKNKTTGAYALGIGVLRLGFDYLSSLDLVQHGQPVIQHLRDSTGYSAHLTILDGRDVVYVARAAAAGEISPGVGIGSRLPAHCTALGRTLLLSHQRADFDTLFGETKFAATSAQGPKTPKGLWLLLEEDRRRGHVVSESFYQPGISSVVYPLRDAQDTVVAAVSVMVPRGTLEPKLKRDLQRAVAQAAANIEAFLRPSVYANGAVTGGRAA